MPVDLNFELKALSFSLSLTKHTHTHTHTNFVGGLLCAGLLNLRVNSPLSDVSGMKSQVAWCDVK
jgi:hypothetical protein